MGYYTGIDVSLEVSHFCVVDAAGKVVKEARVASEPEEILGRGLQGLGSRLRRSALRQVPCRSGCMQR